MIAFVLWTVPLFICGFWLGSSFEQDRQKRARGERAAIRAFAERQRRLTSSLRSKGPRP